MNDRLLRLLLTCHLHVTRPRDERGDVPGWVMVTVMTAGIVAVIWTAAETKLGEMLAAALQKVQSKG